MTPARLSEIECPNCHEAMWIVDCDFLEAGFLEPAGQRKIELGYGERPYGCPACGRRGPGWSVLQQAPPEFLLQPHRLYPMSQEEFDHWVAVLRKHFPGHPRLMELGSTFYPCSPEEAAAFRREWEPLLRRER